MDSDQGLIGLGSSVERLLELCWWDVFEVAVDALGVVPVNPGQGGELDVLDGLSGPAVSCGAADELGLVVAADGLGQGVVVKVTESADRRCRVDLSEAFAVTQRRELTGTCLSRCGQRPVLAAGRT